MHGHVVEDRDRSRLAVDLTTATSTMKPCEADEYAILVVRRIEVRRGEERGPTSPGSIPRRERLRVPVAHPGDATQRGVSSPACSRIAAIFAASLSRAARAAPGSDAAEPRGVGARRRPTTAFAEVSISPMTSISAGSTPSGSATICAATVRWPCPCGVVDSRHGDAAERADGDDAALGVSRLGQPRRALAGGVRASVM